jgi:hypothetical protein
MLDAKETTAQRDARLAEAADKASSDPVYLATLLDQPDAKKEGEKPKPRKPVVCYREQWPTKEKPFARHSRLDN